MKRCRRYKHWKLKYPDEAAAQRAAADMAARYQKPFQGYLCEDGCGYWHVGRPPKNDRRQPPMD